MLLICQGCLVEESSLTSGLEDNRQKCLLRQKERTAQENLQASPARPTGLKKEITAAREEIREKKILSLLILLGSDRAGTNRPSVTF